ncbi:endonuclease/Exonuclease/phosphatase [Plectosphaerella cucumerina]|uniref:Endonuclease/Exonuclease/phosphatase n=1 Tax=Plectosphaerella cucumerina TaxID=40658 RepID=A0A8K0X1F6_9PEZI|nr:endonuclease/Exonuclease/phosphatase [Plectosphaerella cucumerina]
MAAAAPHDNPSANMAPSTLDLFILTFNCAKNFINASIFSSHIHAAFKQNATTLPDVVVFSLQEVAPLSYSFIGGYFLSPYLARYEEALNLAASRFSSPSTADDDTITVEPTASPVRPYTLVRTRNVGMTAIMLFARDPAALQSVQEAEVGFGAAEMGNKGAVALRFAYDGGDGADATELTFVATHLAAMEWNLPKRNANWAAIMRGLTFENPEVVLDPKAAALRETQGEAGPGIKGTRASRGQAEAEDSDSDSDTEQDRLLHDEHHARDLHLQSQLHDISVFRPTSHLFVAGDLNYRISSRSPPPQADFPSLDPSSEHFYSRFFPLDQLTRERKAGRTFHGMAEADVNFPPTYKYDVLPATTKEADGADVPWEFASHRWPSWTDRVLFLDVPRWVKRRAAKEKQQISVTAYDAMPVVRTSDHRAVFFRARVPLLSPEEMALDEEVTTEGDGDDGEVEDPRVKLPVAIDPEAWERRAAARRREVFAGWSMFLWSTKQGALVIATVLAVGVSGWWFVRGLL